MITASEFGIPPHQWDMMPLSSRAEMMAVVETKGLMNSYRYEQD